MMKLRSISGEKQKQLEMSKTLFTTQMAGVKNRKAEYLQISLPASLDCLQSLSVQSGQYMMGVWLR